MCIIQAIAKNVAPRTAKLPNAASMLISNNLSSTLRSISSRGRVSEYFGSSVSCQYLNVPFFDDFVDFIFREFRGQPARCWRCQPVNYFGYFFDRFKLQPSPLIQ